VTKPKLEIVFIVVLVLVLLISLVAALSRWPFQLVASPVAVLRIVDGDGRPLAGIRIIRKWDTSEGQKGEDQITTDKQGKARFERIEFRLSQMKRVAKPLLVLVPSSCGPDWEVYGHAEFDIFWPVGYHLSFGSAEWKKVAATFENRDGIHIYDPSQASQTNYVGLYIFNKRDDFDYTLTLYGNGNE
jgi:hypothetical protein